MGAFSRVKNIIIPDPDNAKDSETFRKKWGWEAHEQITLKGAFTAGDQESVANVSTAIDADGKPILLAGTGRTHILERMIVSWTLADERGNVVEISLANILQLPTNYTTPLLDVCDRLAAGMSKEAQQHFLASANGHTRASLDLVK